MKKVIWIFLFVFLLPSVPHCQSDDSDFLGEDELQTESMTKKPDT